MRQEQVPAWQRHLPPGYDGRPEHLGADGTLPRLWVDSWRSDEGRTVLLDDVDAARNLTAAALQSLTAIAAGDLARLGVEPGDRVLWSSAPSIDSAVWLLGAMRLGAVVVPVSPSFTERELAFVVDDVRPVAAVTEPAQQAAILGAAPEVRSVRIDSLRHGTDQAGPPLDAAHPDDDALIVYTSGTTGNPKGAVHTHRSLMAGVEAIRLAWAWEPDDHLILSLPLFHVHGLCAGLFGTLAAGARATIMDRFAPERVLDAVPGRTMFFGVPTMYHRLGQSGRARELAALRLCVAGSAPLAAELWEAFHTSGVSVLERYGMSETLLTLSNPLVGERRPGSVGLPLPGVEAMLSDQDDAGIGELLVRAPSLCRGYWERPDATAASWRDGWFATGDLASQSGDGYFAIRGRNSELIITGGHNVYPAEVESVLRRHPSVSEVAVVGVPTPEWGESVVAFVVGVDGPPDVGDLEQLAVQSLAPFKRPREYRVVSALPRNAMGKVVRRQLH